jgi:stress-induced morphogen
MQPIEDEIKRRIHDSYPDAEVRLNDLTGTRDHWEATVISSAFAGQTLIKRQKGIYSALGDLMAGPVHAFTMQTLTPQQAQDRGLLTAVNQGELLDIEG